MAIYSNFAQKLLYRDETGLTRKPLTIVVDADFFG